MKDETNSFEFFSILEKDAGFCAALGKVMINAGRLESSLKHYLQNDAPEMRAQKIALSRLIKEAKNAGLPSVIIMHLETLNDQRNYLAHNLHALFHGLISETLLPRENLSEVDIEYFKNAADQLARDLNQFSSIIQKHTT